jgi:hypothetical protein
MPRPISSPSFNFFILASSHAVNEVFEEKTDGAQGLGFQGMKVTDGREPESGFDYEGSGAASTD